MAVKRNHGLPTGRLLLGDGCSQGGGLAAAFTERGSRPGIPSEREEPSKAQCCGCVCGGGRNDPKACQDAQRAREGPTTFLKEEQPHSVKGEGKGGQEIGGGHHRCREGTTCIN